MKKLLLAAMMLLATCTVSFGQSATWDILKAKAEFWLGTPLRKITGISIDTTFASATDLQFATALAIKKFASKIAGRPVAATAPTLGQTLIWDGSKWGPSTPSAGNISEFVSAGAGVPPSASASANGGETWRNMTTGELWRSDGTVWTIAITGTGNKGPITITTSNAWVINPSAVDSTHIKEASVNFKDMQSGVELPSVLKWNGFQWVSAAPNYGNVWRDSVTARTAPVYEAAKAATVTNKVIEWDADTTSNLSILLTANAALYAPENIRNGGRYTITVKQDGTGGWGLGLPANMQLDDGAGINTQPYSTTSLDCYSDAGALYCSVKKYEQNLGFDLLNAYYDSIEIWVAPSEFGNSFRQTTSMECVTAFGQNVAQYTDPGRNAHILSTGAGATACPTTALVSGKICHQYDGTDDTEIIAGSRNFTLPQTSNFTIGIWFLAGEDGVTDFIFSSTGDGAATGVSLSRTSGNVLKFTINATTGTQVIDFTHSTPVTISTGWVWVEIHRTGTTGTMSVNGASEALTFTTLSGVVGTRDITMGRYGAGGNNLTGKIGNFFFFNRNMSATTMAIFKNWNPTAPNLANMAILRNHTTFAPTDITGLDVVYDFSNSAKVFKDAAGTVPVAVNGDNIRRVDQTNPTYIPKFALSPGASTDPVWRTNQKNSLAVSEFAEGLVDRLEFNTQAMLSTNEGQGSWFIVFKPLDTLLPRKILSDGSSNGLAQSTPGTPSGGQMITPHEQNMYMTRPDSFARTSPYYAFSTAIRKYDWNVVELRHRGAEWYLSCNGSNLNRVSQTKIPIQFYELGHPTSTVSFLGFIGQVVHYNQFLSTPQAQKVVDYLETKWAINCGQIANNPDAGRTTLIDYKYTGPNYYIGFPYAETRNDTLWMSWKETKNAHNDSYNASEGIFLRPFNKKFQPLAAAQNILPDILPPASNAYRDHGGYFHFMPDGRMIIGGTQYDGQASPGGRDTIKAIYRIREINGTLGAIQYITVPGYAWFSVTEGITVIGSTWYVSGYGSAGGIHYRVAIIKSTNSGSSWSVVAEWNGNTLHGGSDPEEPSLLKNSDGRWMMFYREDVQHKIYMASTTNIDSWNVAQAALTEIGTGHARPGVCEMADKTLVLSTGKMTTSRPNERRAIYYTSKNGGRTWVGPIEHDKYRTDVAGFKQMYGQAVDMGGGVCALLWGAEAGSNFAISIGGYVANISYKLFRP